jgi:hypothetical protein
MSDIPSSPASAPNNPHRLAPLDIALAFPVLFALLLLIFAGLLAINEVNSRVSALASIEAEIKELNSELTSESKANSARAEVLANLPSTGQKEVDRTLIDGQIRSRSLVEKIEITKSAKAQIQSLVSHGATDNSISLRAIQRRSLGFKAEEAQAAASPEWQKIIAPVLALPSDLLSALAALACAALGAGVTSLRYDGRLNFRPIFLGLATGFLVYLGVKGGRHVFLLTNASDVITLNPFSLSFAALIAGMFTERTFELLSALVDSLSNKIKSALAK